MNEYEKKCDRCGRPARHLVDGKYLCHKCYMQEDLTTIRKNCHLCRYEGQDVEKCYNCSKSDGMPYFELKEITNRQWLNCLTDEAYANEISMMIGCIGKYATFRENINTKEAIKEWLTKIHKE